MKHSDLKQSNMSSFIYLLIYTIQRPVWHYILPPGHWVQAVGSHHRLMSTYREVMGPVRAPYRAQHLKRPQWWAWIETLAVRSRVRSTNR